MPKSLSLSLTPTLPLWLLLALACVLVSAQEARAMDGFTLRFGLLQTNEDGGADFVKETKEIPYKTKETGQRFGYEIVPDDQQTPYEVYRVFTFGNIPETFTGTLSKDQLDATGSTLTTKTTICTGTKRFYSWLDPGDPAGPVRIDLFINGEPADSVDITILEPE